jgi:DNA polymerase III sliding clamp (beta) subunit (PCNA family)
VQFTAGPEDIRILEMDPANVAMVMFKLPKSSCLDYEVPELEEKVGLKLSNLTPVLRRVGKDDILLLETKNNQLIVKIGASREFKLPTIALDDHKEQKWPEIQLPAKIKMDTQALNEALEDVTVITDSVKFIVTPGDLTITGEGDLAFVKIEMKNSDTTRILGDFGEKVATKYSTEYLTKMILKSSVAKEVTLEYNKDMPLRLSYVTDSFSLNYLLAPRVEND